ncbi:MULTISPECIES: hypothetical protein [Nostocales]|uniref:hypothetical protein n=1 Tax=Nostocales TaxID=1161 RepID=UPI0004AFE8BC|nr:MULTISPECIES: hypothetical protein [Nostocales]
MKGGSPSPPFGVEKQVIADTFGQAATIWDLPGRLAAESAREYERLFKEIMGMLK